MVEASKNICSFRVLYFWITFNLKVVNVTLRLNDNYVDKLTFHFSGSRKHLQHSIFKLDLLGWYWLIRFYSFQMYNSIKAAFLKWVFPVFFRVFFQTDKTRSASWNLQVPASSVTAASASWMVLVGKCPGFHKR